MDKKLIKLLRSARKKKRSKVLSAFCKCIMSAGGRSKLAEAMIAPIRRNIGYANIAACFFHKYRYYYIYA